MTSCNLAVFLPIPYWSYNDNTTKIAEASVQSCTACKQHFDYHFPLLVPYGIKFFLI